MFSCITATAKRWERMTAFIGNQATLATVATALAGWKILQDPTHGSARGEHRIVTGNDSDEAVR